MYQEEGIISLILFSEDTYTLWCGYSSSYDIILFTYSYSHDLTVLISYMCCILCVIGYPYRINKYDVTYYHWIVNGEDGKEKEESIPLLYIIISIR